jgi:hypothetical protein
MYDINCIDACSYLIYQPVDAMIELKAPAPKPAIRELVKEDASSPTKTTIAQVTLSSQQFSMLYGPENCASAVSYPTLPSLNADSNTYYNGSMLENQPPPYEDTVYEDVEEVDDEDAPFLAPTVSRMSADDRGAVIQSPQQQHVRISSSIL